MTATPSRAPSTPCPTVSRSLPATHKSVGLFLSMFQFSEADLRQRTGKLSGGQRAGGRWRSACCLVHQCSTEQPPRPRQRPSEGTRPRALSPRGDRGQPRPVLHRQDCQSAVGVWGWGAGIISAELTLLFVVHRSEYSGSFDQIPCRTFYSRFQRSCELL